jgi:hypothetical protein
MCKISKAFKTIRCQTITYMYEKKSALFKFCTYIIQNSLEKFSIHIISNHFQKYSVPGGLNSREK